MSNENFDEKLKKYDRAEELKREEKGSRKMCAIIFIGIFIAVCIAIWLITYFIRSAQIDDYVESINYVNDTETESSGSVVKLVTVTIDGVDYTLDDLKDKTDLPTVVDVTVTYTDDSTVTKSAYISYVDSKDIKEVSYQDNEYGRVIIPRAE